jgi:hypothetical protein
MEQTEQLSSLLRSREPHPSRQMAQVKTAWSKLTRSWKLDFWTHLTDSQTTPQIHDTSPGMILWHLWTGAIAELIPLLGFELC